MLGIIGGTLRGSVLVAVGWTGVLVGAVGMLGIVGGALLGPVVVPGGWTGMLLGAVGMLLGEVPPGSVLGAVGWTAGGL